MSGDALASPGPPEGSAGGDLTACDREPIHIPGAIQPHGHLLAFAGAELRLSHASAAAAGRLLPDDPAAAFGRPLEDVLRLEGAADLAEALRHLSGARPVQLGAWRTEAEKFQAIAHRSPDGFTVLELEAVPALEAGLAATTLETLYPGLRTAFERLERSEDMAALATAAAEEVRRMTGFDRVLVYRFDTNWDGIVVAESGNGRLPSYLGLRFPASDIPAQARRLYEVNSQRLIADAAYRPVPILAAPARQGAPPLDLSFATLRSVSPIHLEYMRNMGTPASMSVSLLRRDRLWGLISCHHAEPRRVSFAVRGACDLLGQMLSVRLAAQEETAHAEERARLKSLEGSLLARMASAEAGFPAGLVQAPEELCRLTGAAGAAVVTEQGCLAVGRTPPEAEIRRIVAWLGSRGGPELYATACLGEEMPGVGALASGLLAISISRLHPSHVLWFRPEVVATIRWGGDPRKAARIETGRINPRLSFAAWLETVRGRSTPWSAAEVAAARDLRTAILGVVLRRAEELAELTGKLERINKELTAFSYSISHDLRAPFRHIVGYAELLRELEGEGLSETGSRYLGTIIESAETAGKLVDALLNFSQMGRAPLLQVPVEMDLLMAEAIRSLAHETAGRNIEWRLGKLPLVHGDPTMLRQVLHNLLSNAVKYTGRRERAVIEVRCEEDGEAFKFLVRDNGTGFDMAYAHKLFGVFQRLHRVEEFEGVGIGLANVRRIVERHGGRAWAEGEPDRGATFFFTLPRATPSPIGEHG